MKRIFTDSELKDIYQTYQETGSLTQTSAKFNTTNGKIKTLLSQVGITDVSLDIKIDEVTKQKIIYDYINKRPLQEMISEYGILSDTLLKNLKSWGIKFNRASNSGKRGKRKITDEQEKEICRLYTEEKLSTWKIAPIFDVLNVCILKVLRRNNIPRRTRSIAARQYTLDESYFEKINTPSKAYFLGLIYAEGHLELEGRNTLTLALQEQDGYILEFCKNELKSNRPLEFRKRQQEHHQDAICLRISSLKYMSDLGKLGIDMGKKSNKITFPEFLDKELYPYFILGYYDGDGCTYTSNDYSHMQASFAGNPQFMEGIRDYIKNELNIKSRIYYCDIENQPHNAKLEGMGRYASIKLLDWLYSHNPPIYMTRKFNKYKQFIMNRLEFYKNRNIASDNNINNQKILKDAFHTIQSIESQKQ